MTAGNPAVVVDFDGTITTTDSSVTLVERFAAPGWQDVHRRYLGGEFGMRHWLQRMPALLTASTKEMLAYLLPRLELAAGFVEFCAYARRHALPVYVASDGLGFYIAPFLERHGLGHLPVLANTFADGGQVGHPHLHPSCPVCGTCKAALVGRLRAAYGRVVFVGDGFNDRFGSSHADAVLARSGARLEAYCRQHGLPHWSFRDFRDVQAWLQSPPAYPGPRPICPARPGR
jgi:2,3-diketo-5-methylthio-1-phosphopentane phosphatase